MEVEFHNIYNIPMPELGRFNPECQIGEKVVGKDFFKDGIKCETHPSPAFPFQPGPDTRAGEGRWGQGGQLQYFGTYF